jgi:hypothetical protein
MATDDSTTTTAAAALPEHCDVLNALLDIKGAMGISRRLVSSTADVVTLAEHAMESANTLSGVDGVLTLAEAAIERLYEQLAAMSDAWPASREEVAHG